jgi:2-hydroxycyclohexanecarboxyl-CoA dehydrogenase
MSQGLFRLEGLGALVTGAGQGMGVGIVRALATQGAKVALNDLFPERAEATAAALRAEGLAVTAVAGDITQPATREAIVAAARQTVGQIDILVNNAGVPVGMPNSLRHFRQLSPPDFERQLDLNFRAVMGMTQLVLEGMLERHFGRIILITSESWRIGLSMGLTDYASAKAAALGFMRHLAHETGREGITANALSLGTMNNYPYDEIAKRTTAVGRSGSPEDVGAAVAFLASRECSWLTGQTIALNGGSTTV